MIAGDLLGCYELNYLIRLAILPIRMGFHWPPFNSIKHLHLHVIFPETSISIVGRLIYRPGSFYFATVFDSYKLNTHLKSNGCFSLKH